MSQLLRSFARIAATSRSSTSTLPHQLFFSRANNSHFPVRKFSSTKSIFEATLDMAPVNTTSRLESLRKLMSERSIDIYIVPSADAHQSEYTAPCDARREYISGFSGSAGTAVITLDKAALSTDGRYFNQASQQLDSNWHLLKAGIQGVATWQQWTAQESVGRKVAAIDPAIITTGAAKNLSDQIKEKGGTLTAHFENLVDSVWGDARPPRPANAVKVHPVEFAGKGFDEKIAELRKTLKEKHLAGFVVSLLDDMAWLFNLRGSDIPHNPVFFAYALVMPESTDLYINESQLSSEARAQLEGKVNIKPYESLISDLHILRSAEDATDGSSSRKFGISTDASWGLNLALGANEKVVQIPSPIQDSKAIKNEAELKGMRECHIRDGAALSEYFAWLENQLSKKDVKIDEISGSDHLERCRAKQQLFVGPSFETVSSTGANAAIIHYSPERGNCAVIDPNAVYLCDSGGQYLDGTTDTTRTWHFGQPSEKEKLAFTLVLKGVIELASAIFPKGTTGYALDTLARKHLWQRGLDYRHGTGHGVGSYLNVHEGPMGISYRPAYTKYPIVPGHVISDEPGYYEDGLFGIRTENIFMCREVQTEFSFGDKPWFGFETVTMTPICKNLIEPSLLSSEEKVWLNNYHHRIWDNTSSYFEKDEITLNWLRKETTPI